MLPTKELTGQNMVLKKPQRAAKMALLWSVPIYLHQTRSQESPGGLATAPSQARAGEPVPGPPGRPAPHQSHTGSAPHQNRRPAQPGGCSSRQPASPFSSSHAVISRSVSTGDAARSAGLKVTCGGQAQVSEARCLLLTRLKSEL